MSLERKKLVVMASEKLGGDIVSQFKAAPHPEADYYFVRSNVETDCVKRLACSVRGKTYQWVADEQGYGFWKEVSNFLGRMPQKRKM